MTRLELLVAAGVMIAVCVLSCAQPGYADPGAMDAAADSPLLAALLPLQRHSFHVAAVAVTLLGLLLEDGRRRKLADNRPSARER